MSRGLFIFKTCVAAPTLFGGVAFSIVGSYTEYQNTKKYDDVTAHYVQTVMGAAAGATLGVTLGFFWPISVATYIARKYEGLPHIPKNEYTLHKRRDT
jgi:hypothetical protein